MFSKAKTSPSDANPDANQPAPGSSSPADAKKQGKKKLVRLVVEVLLLAAAVAVYVGVTLMFKAGDDGLNLSDIAAKGQRYGQKAIDGDACLKVSVRQDFSACNGDRNCAHNLVNAFATACLKTVAAKGRSLDAPCRISKEDFEQRYCNVSQRYRWVCKGFDDHTFYHETVCQPDGGAALLKSRIKTTVLDGTAAQATPTAPVAPAASSAPDSQGEQP